MIFLDQMNGHTHQKVEHGQAEHFEGDAHVAVVIEPVEHLNAQAAKEG